LWVARTIVELRCGAHLYGTATPQSDTDLKSVVLPDPRTILLQRAGATLTACRAKADGERNSATDTDHEAFSLHRFMDLLITGQPIAIEMIFAPDSAMTRPADPLWRDVQALAPQVVGWRRSFATAGNRPTAMASEVRVSPMHDGRLRCWMRPAAATALRPG
jgi:hypothetical protein